MLMVRETFWERVWHYLRRPFQVVLRGQTPLEADQAAEVQRLRHLLGEREAEVHALKYQVQELEGATRIQARELELLALVLERAHKRYESEIAVEAQRVATATLTAQVLQRGEP